MKTAVVIPNYNGEDYLAEAIGSILAQSARCTLVVVENGSSDSSRDLLESYGDKIVALYNPTNLGFDGGVNTGIRWALERDYDAVALFNNDAVADKDWLRSLQHELKNNIGIVTGIIQTQDGSHIDTTGDILTTWGLSFPRGRGSSVSTNPYTYAEYVFGASGGASLYAVKMLREIGLFDEDFFAYYEDADISFRAQLAGWRVRYTPLAICYHRLSQTSTRMKNGFMTYQSVKNMPMVVTKNTPDGLRHIIYPRFALSYVLFLGSASLRGEFFPALRGFIEYLSLVPKKLRERKINLSRMKVSNDYIMSVLTQDLPENAHKLRKLRALWWKVIRRRA